MAFGKRGFTLVELLVATTLITLVMGSAYTLFYSTISAWRHTERGYNVHEEGRDAVATFRRELNNLLSDAAHLAEGEGQEFLAFVVAEPFDPESAGEGRRLMQVRYHYDRRERTLIREEALVDAALPKPPPEYGRVDRSRIRLRAESAFVMARHVEDFSLRYIWMPWPENRDWEQPPPRVQPLVVERHLGEWGIGYPQALEITLVLLDQEEGGSRHTITATLPLHAKQMRHPERTLLERMGGAA